MGLDQLQTSGDVGLRAAVDGADQVCVGRGPYNMWMMGLAKIRHVSEIEDGMKGDVAGLGRGNCRKVERRTSKNAHLASVDHDVSQHRHPPRPTTGRGI